MLTHLIFDWAQRTPDRTAVIHNGHAWSYRSFAQAIAAARGYFARCGYVGPGYAVLALSNTMNFWILSLALRSLGLTTVSVKSSAMIRELGLANVHCVVTEPGLRAELDGLCTELDLRLLAVSLAGEAALGLEAPGAQHHLGGHILLTSGTTGHYKMVLMSPEIDANVLPLHVKLFGINQHTLLSVFDFGTWTGAGYK
jgi:acyl-CoA synthetase (AMP-forming)/AMP-acid ligase II